MEPDCDSIYTTLWMDSITINRQYVSKSLLIVFGKFNINTISNNDNNNAPPPLWKTDDYIIIILIITL